MWVSELTAYLHTARGLGGQATLQQVALGLCDWCVLSCGTTGPARVLTWKRRGGQHASLDGFARTQTLSITHTSSILANHGSIFSSHTPPGSAASSYLRLEVSSRFPARDRCASSPSDPAGGHPVGDPPGERMGNRTELLEPDALKIDRTVLNCYMCWGTIARLTMASGRSARRSTQAPPLPPPQPDWDLHTLPDPTPMLWASQLCFRHVGHHATYAYITSATIACRSIS